MRTPRKAGGRCSASTSAYWAAAVRPEAAMARAPTTARRPRTGSAHRCLMPARTSTRHPAGPAGALARSRSRSRRTAPAATAKDRASTSTTPWPPIQANRPAPSSGASSFDPSWMVRRRPLTPPRASGGTNSLKSAVSAGSTSTSTAPYPSMTARTSQTCPASRTSSSASRPPAATRLTSMSSRRRPTRSAISPATGASSEGAYTHNETRAAARLLPVSDFTQMPATRVMAPVPRDDAVSPARYRRTSREPTMTLYRPRAGDVQRS